MEALRKLRREAPWGWEVVPIFDQSAGRFPVRRYSFKSQVTTYQEVESALGYPGRFQYCPGSFRPGKADTLLMWFFKKRSRFDFYWVVEYDVRYTGHWGRFFGSFRKNTNDLLGTTLFHYAFRPSWPHWESLAGPEVVPMEERIRFFPPLFRLSRRALVALDEHYQAGWTGHYEVIIPTLLDRLGMTMEDIRQHYTNSPENAGIKPGSFVAGGSNTMPENPPPNLLWHPFKD